MALWLTSETGGALSQAELGDYFGHSGAWINHLVKGRWHKLKLLPEQMRLMRVIWKRERLRRQLPRELNERVAEAQRKAGEVIADLEQILRILERRNKVKR